MSCNTSAVGIQASALRRRCTDSQGRACVCLSGTVCIREGKKISFCSMTDFCGRSWLLRVRQTSRIMAPFS